MTPSEKPPCQIWEVRKPYRTMIFCKCGWSSSVFHRNAMARASRATKIENDHLKSKEKVMKKPEKEMPGVMRALRELHDTGSIYDKTVAGFPVSHRLISRGLAVLGEKDPGTGIKPLIITEHGHKVLKENPS